MVVGRLHPQLSLFKFVTAGFVCSLGVLVTGALGACDDGGDARIATILELSGDIDRGEELYASECASCHRADGRGSAGGGRGKDLTVWVGRNSASELVEAIIGGTSGMPSFGTFLDDQQIADLAAYVRDAFGR